MSKKYNPILCEYCDDGAYGPNSVGDLNFCCKGCAENMIEDIQYWIALRNENEEIEKVLGGARSE